MITKIIEVEDLLSLKITAPKTVFDNIDNTYPNLKESTNYDYDIKYEEVKELPSKYIIKKGKIKTPFRNSKYYVNKINNEIIAYAPKQLLTNEHVIIRNNKFIHLLVTNDEKSKNLTRLIEELIIRKLLEKNYFPIHSSCVSDMNNASLFIGSKGSGKSTALLSYVVLKKSDIISNDITFVGKENNTWYAFGTNYDLTFDKSLKNDFDAIYFNNSCNNDDIYKNNKYRYTPKQFINNFQVSLRYKASIRGINIVGLKQDKQFHKSSNINNGKALISLLKYSKERNFTFDDFLNINNLVPNYNYKQLVKDVFFNEITGNLIKEQKEEALRYLKNEDLKIDYSIVSRGTEKYNNCGYMAVSEQKNFNTYILNVDHGVTRTKLVEGYLRFSGKYSIENIALSRFQLITALVYEKNKHNIKNNVLILGIGNVGFSCLMYLLDNNYKDITIYIKQKKSYMTNLKSIIKKEYKVNLKFIEALDDIDRYSTFVDTTGSSRVLKEVFESITNNKTILILSTPREEKYKISPLQVNRKNLIIIGGHEFNGIDPKIRNDLYQKLLKMNQKKEYLDKFINTYNYSKDKLNQIKLEKGNFIELFKY